MRRKTFITRRGFLAATAAAAGYAAGGSTKPISAASTARVRGANEALRIAVIGCGQRGTALTQAILERRRTGEAVCLTAVCDIHEARARRARALAGPCAQQRWQDVVERDDLDAVVVATPDHWHAPMAVAAMECGKDVYCETPMALRIEDAKAFRDCARRTGRVVQIGAEQTSEGQWHTARELVEAGRIGGPVWSQGSYTRHPDCGAISKGACPDSLDWDAFLGEAPKRPFDPDRYARWQAYWDYSGGIATERFYPQLAALLVALGPAFPTRVSAAGGVYARDGREVPDSLVMSCAYPGDHTVVLASAMARADGFPAVIRGDKATLEFLGEQVRLTPEHSDRRSWGARVRGDRPVHVPAETRRGHLDDWLGAIRTRRQCACDEELGYRTAVAIGMAIEAYRQGRTLYFDAIREEVNVQPV